VAQKVAADLVQNLQLESWIRVRLFIRFMVIVYAW
jgi:hypothetical protein